MPFRKQTRLSRRITDLGLSPEVRRTFADGLFEVAQAGGGPSEDALALIQRLIDRPSARPAPFEALWPHAETFLLSCIYVSVADGQYSVEEARVVSLLAHRLGHSAHQLAAIEDRAFQELKVRGAEGLERDRRQAAQADGIAIEHIDEAPLGAHFDDDMEPTQLAHPGRGAAHRADEP